jgi:hypothetical protein
LSFRCSKRQWPIAAHAGRFKLGLKMEALGYPRPHPPLSKTPLF